MWWNHEESPDREPIGFSSWKWSGCGVSFRRIRTWTPKVGQLFKVLRWTVGVVHIQASDKEAQGTSDEALAQAFKACTWLISFKRRRDSGHLCQVRIFPPEPHQRGNGFLWARTRGPFQDGPDYQHRLQETRQRMVSRHKKTPPVLTMSCLFVITPD